MGYETFGLAPALEEFVAVARHGHITRAATELGIPQPTLSRVIARLSDEIGVPLVQRDGRGIQLTRGGRRLAEHVERALAELLAGVRAVRAEADPDLGTAVLGFLHSMGPSIVPDLLKQFRKARPGVTVRLVQDRSDELVRQVASGHIDLCIAAPSQAPRDPRVRSRRLAVQPLVLLVPARHRLAPSPSVRLTDLDEEPLITLNRGFGLRTLTDRLFSSSGRTPSYIFESQDIATASGLVAAGLGMALLPAGSRIPGTTELPIADAGATRSISLTWRPDRLSTPPVMELQRHILDTAPELFSRDR